jgi:hypothetical protein
MDQEALGKLLLTKINTLKIKESTARKRGLGIFNQLKLGASMNKAICNHTMPGTEPRKKTCITSQRMAKAHKACPKQERALNKSPAALPSNRLELRTRILWL